MRRLSLLAALLLAMVSLPGRGQTSQQLYDNFLNPGGDYRPRVWWHWMNGNITKDGIRKDLQWMKRAGIGGVHVFDAGLETPQIVKQRLVYMTPEWKDAFRYAINLADSLGLEVTVPSAPGWSETGGPWVKPEDGMKKLVWRTMEVRGKGRTEKLTLPAPFTNTGSFLDYGRMADAVSQSFEKKDFYREVAVLAIPVPDADLSMSELAPRLSTSGGKVTLEQMVNDSLSDFSELMADSSGNFWVQSDFGQSRSISCVEWTVVKNKGAQFGYSTELLSSDDGVRFKRVASIGYQPGPAFVYDIPATSARYFRLVFRNTDKAVPDARFLLSNFKLFTVPRVNYMTDKSGFTLYRYGVNMATTESQAAIDPARIVDLTDKVVGGVLTWRVPKGRWRIMRFGYSLTGKVNHPASPEATGLEVDKLDSAAIHRYYTNYLNTYVDASDGMMGRKGITHLLNDSYEAGPQTWTAKMETEFRNRKGYDLKPWLPAVAGYIVGSTEQTERFLFDWRMAIGDMIADYHYNSLPDILRPYGLKRYTESHEAWRSNLSDGMEDKRTADIPMSAVWMRYNQKKIIDTQNESDIRESASVAHIYGQQVAAAESFTSDGFRDGAFVYTPTVLKPTADAALAAGLNLFVVHCSPHQPVDDKVPGIGLGKYGQWFNRHETWAPQAKAWTDYLARSCYLLRQGHFVADVAYYYGEDTSVTGRYQTGLPKFPSSNSYDFVSPQILLDVLRPEGGRLVTASGMSYRVLWIDCQDRMSIKVLRRLKQLADAGIVIGGKKPSQLMGMEGSDSEFKSLVSDIWESGRKNVFSGKTVAQVLTAAGVAPDVSYGDTKAALKYVHRRLAGGDIYWVANQTANAQPVTLSFNVSDKKPQLWHAETGLCEDVNYVIEGGRTKVSFSMTPFDAVFVVFLDAERQPSLQLPVKRSTVMTTVGGPWKVDFRTQCGQPEAIQLDSLRSLTVSTIPAVKYFSGQAIYTSTFQLAKKQLKGKLQPERIMLNLGEVHDLAEVRVNGQSVGIAWHTPYNLDITAAVKSGTNTLEVTVVNPWHNRIVGDRQPGATPVTYYPVKFYTADEPLLPAGLVGPVTVVGIK